MTRSAARLLLRHHNEAGWRSPQTTAYPDEAALQRLLEESPTLLDMEGVERPLVVARELYVPATGPIDLVAVSSEGDVVLVECKLRANPEIRRHVIGQLLAYASGIWQMAYEDFDRAFADRRSLTLMEAMRVAIGASDFDEEGFRERVAQRLASGQFRMVVAVDDITDELRRIIEFANRITRPGVAILAMELRYIADGDVEILLPSIYGSEIAASKSPPKEANDYDWDSYADLGIPVDRLTVGKALLRAAEEAIAARDLPWSSQFRKGYIAIQRNGGYNVAIIDLYYNAVPRLAVKIPAPPDVLGLTDPYAGKYRVTYQPGDNEWGWTVPTPDQVPDIGAALDLVRPFHPERGPMTTGERS